MTLSFQKRLTVISLVLYWPTLFILAHIPIPQLVRQANVSDKSLHFVAYLILAFLLWFAFNPGRKVNWRKAAVWWVLLVIAGYGIVDELLQGCVGGRSCDAMDYLANLAGMMTGLILSSFFSFWSVFLIVTGITIFSLTNVARANVAELLPVTSAVFYLFAYSFFTILWIQYIHLFFRAKAPEFKWLMIALVIPLIFLTFVKLFSIILDRSFAAQNIILSAVGIVTVTIISYLSAIIRLRRGFGGQVRKP